MSTLKSECRKFSPNVFNKTKCQNCFRTKEVHSAEALENNRASRIVSKCGYLFVAPDWDFNVSVNRTKRWQRRWFKLFDDGELTYALDEFPDTIPQGTIDMNKVLDVSDAETVTGNEFAIAITTPEKVHFIKGTSKEESKWWFDALTRVLPRHLSRGKHKRNATFPCGKAIIPPAAVISQDYSEDDIRLKKLTRPKFLSTSEIHPIDDKDWILPSQPDGDEDVFSTKEENALANGEERGSNNSSDVEVKNVLNKLKSESMKDDETSQLDVRSTSDKSETMEQSNADDSQLSSQRRNRRYLKRENRVQRNQRSRFEGVSKLIPSKRAGDKNLMNDAPDHSLSSNAIAASEKLEYLESIQKKGDQCATPQNHLPTDESSSTSDVKNSRATTSLPAKTNLRKSESLKNIPSASQSDMREQGTSLRRYHSFRGPYSQRKSRTCGTPSQKKSKVVSSSLRPNKESSSPSVHTEHPESPLYNMGDELKKEGVFTKTGWLLRQTLTKDWSRHWFVLKDSSLAYYRDSSAENCGIMDGILDLNQVSSIRECESDRHYAFSLLMWDSKKYILATESEHMRCMWIQAIQYASNLWSSESKEDFIKTEIVLPDHSYYHDRVSSPSSPAPLPSADDDKPSESSSSDDQSEYYSIVDEDEVTPCSMYRDDDEDMILSSQQLINENIFSFDENLCRNSSLLETFNGFFHIPNGEDRLSKSEEEKTETEFSEADTSYGKTISDEVFSGQSSLPTPENGCYVCVKVRTKLNAAKEEIRKLRDELREAHSSYDNLEMFSYKLQQDMKRKEQSYDSQISLMTAKIDDLTAKYTLAERNYRQLKQKVAKGEYKQEKRKSSLKNKDVLSLSKEYESKLSELETKIICIESSLQKDVSIALESNSTSLEVEEKHENDLSDSTSQNVPTKLTSKEPNVGLFSRLQTLGARVKSASDMISDRIYNSDSEKPKIFVQVRDTEESNSLDDTDDYRTASSANTTCNLEDVGDDVVVPLNLSECQSLLTEKLGKLLDWLKNSLDYICKPDNLADGTPDEKSLLIANVNEVLNYLYQTVPDEIKNSETKTVYYSVLLFTEVLKVIERISILRYTDCLLKLNIVEWGFKVIWKTMCNILFKREKSEFSGVLSLVSEIPHIKHFCPFINKLLLDDKDNISLPNISDRLRQLNDQRVSILKSFEEAKNVRFMLLWDTLLEVPVQDDAIPSSQKISPMLRYVASVASNIYKTAELQLLCFQSQSLHVLKTQHDVIHAWCIKTSESLRYNFGAYLEELKERCPMINELTIPVSELSAVSHKEITSVISELCFLNISSVVLDTSLMFLSNGKENVSIESLSHEKWISQLQKNYSSKANFIANGAFSECSQCSILNDMISDSKSKLLVNYSNVFNKKCKIDDLQFELENFSSDLNNVCANCFDIYPENLLNANGKDGCNNWNCSQCERLQVQLDLLEKEHGSELNSLANNFRNELEILEQKLQNNNELHEQQLRKKESELETAVSELHRLKNEYEEQIQNFKNLYEQKLRFQHDSIEENTICEMYKREIEDIKDMFKKGLLAIENSHNRITTEMEKRHKEEIALLEAEKQKALELEAQATVKALEAIKNSHAKQLQDETTSIKEELRNKYQSAGEYESFYQKYGIELEELKAEILHISDLYSEKCMENVALEEKVSSLRQQLQEAHNELYELLIRNRDLDLHLPEN